MPPPSTCYGFLLALVGEENRIKHCGVRITPAMLVEPYHSIVLRTAWRIKVSLAGLGNGPNKSPVEQELLTGVELAVWIDSSGEESVPNLEARILTALTDPAKICRFGGLALGESSHLVNDVKLILPSEKQKQKIFKLNVHGRMSLPIWVDHVGSIHTRSVFGNLYEQSLVPPALDEMPVINPD